MAVKGTEYRMWARLAQREDLPEAAFCAVVDGLLPDDGRFKKGWQEDVFRETLPSLFRRVGEQELRERLIAVSGSQVPQLVRQGVLGWRDIPAVLRCRTADGELLGALAQHDAHRDVVTGLIEATGLEQLIVVLLSAEALRPDDPNRLPEVPKWLFDALVRRGLSLVAAKVNAFAAVNVQAGDSTGSRRDGRGTGLSAWCWSGARKCGWSWPRTLCTGRRSSTRFSTAWTPRRSPTRFWRRACRPWSCRSGRSFPRLRRASASG